MRITRGQVLALVAKWQARLLLDAWKIRVILTTKMGHLAECEASPEYLDAVLRFNPVRLTPENLEETVVHELIHCHTWELWDHAGDAGDKAHERLTSTLQRIVMR